MSEPISHPSGRPVTDFLPAGTSPETPLTEALRRALDVCAADGVPLVFPPGLYRSGPLHLPDGLNCRLERGARLVYVPEETAPLSYAHPEMGPVTSFLWSIGGRDITLCGEGTVDFSGNFWYPPDAPSDGLPDGLFRKDPARLNQPVFFHECRNIRVEGLTFLNSPCWTLTFSLSEHIAVRGLTIRNSRRIPNADGVHLTACSDVFIENCDISGGDDAVALTCITKRDSLNRNVTVKNCRLVSSSAGLRIGHSAENVLAEHLTIADSNRGVGVFTSPGSTMRRIVLRDVNVSTRPFPPGWWGNAEALVIAAVPPDSLIEDILVERFAADSANGVIVRGVERVSDGQPTIRQLAVRSLSLTLRGRASGNDSDNDSGNDSGRWQGVCRPQLDLRPYENAPFPGRAELFVTGAKDASFADVSVREQND